MSKKTAIVTGCTGMDGSHMADLLLSKEYKVYALIRRCSNPSNTNIKHLVDQPDFELVQGDITDSTSVARIIDSVKPDEFYNFCGQSQVGISFAEPVHTFKVNAEGVINVLEAIRIFSPKTKLYQASTSEMFGKNYSIKRTVKLELQEIDDEVVTVDKSVDEKYQGFGTPFISQSPYAAAKLAAHHMVGTYRRGYGVFGCCGILFNHEGTRRSKEFLTRKVTDYIGQLHFNCVDELSSKPFDYDENKLAFFPKLALGNLDAYRDWGSAVDYVRGAYLMLQQPVADDYILATGEAHSVREFVNEAFSHVGLDYTKFVVIDPKFYRPAEVDFLLGDASKAHKVLGWKPEVTFKDLVKLMVDHDIDCNINGTA